MQKPRRATPRKPEHRVHVWRTFLEPAANLLPANRRYLRDNLG